MGNEHHHAATSPADRAAEAQKATWVSVAVNLVMTLAQLIVGWLAHSQSLIAHGLHSFSDLLSDFLVIYATRQSAHPTSKSAPTLAALGPKTSSPPPKPTPKPSAGPTPTPS